MTAHSANSTHAHPFVQSIHPSVIPASLPHYFLAYPLLLLVIKPPPLTSLRWLGHNAQPDDASSLEHNCGTRVKAAEESDVILRKKMPPYALWHKTHSMFLRNPLI